MSYLDENEEENDSQTMLSFMIGSLIVGLVSILIYVLYPSSGITLDEYRRIHDGMTVEQVMAVVGERPKSVESAAFLGESYDRYTWESKDVYEEVSIVFTDDIVVGKMAK